MSQHSRGRSDTHREEIFQGYMSHREGPLQFSSNAGHFIPAKGSLSMQGVVAIYPEYTQGKRRNSTFVAFHFFLLSLIWNEETYQTVPVSRAAETDKALSMLEVKMADTRPYCELFALLMASSWLLKLNIHCTGPKIWWDNDIGHVRTSSSLTNELHSHRYAQFL